MIHEYLLGELIDQIRENIFVIERGILQRLIDFPEETDFLLGVIQDLEDLNYFLIQFR